MLKRLILSTWALAALVLGPGLVAHPPPASATAALGPADDAARPVLVSQAQTSSEAPEKTPDATTTAQVGRPLRVSCPYPRVWTRHRAARNMQEQGWNGQEDYMAFVRNLREINNRCQAGDASSCFLEERRKLMGRLLDVRAQVAAANQLSQALPNSKYGYYSLRNRGHLTMLECALR